MRRWWPFAAVGATGILIAVIGIAGWVHASSTAPSAVHAVRDMAGNPVTIESDALPDTSQVKRMDVQTESGVRFVVPQVGLDVPLASMNEVDHLITPPGFADAYWVRNMGTDPAHPSKGTVYIAMHSVRGAGVGPGDYLVDTKGGGARVSIGATIRVGDTTYRVTGAKSISKHDLATSADVWADTPGELVVITCLQTPDGHPSTQNLVVFGTATAGG